KETLRTLGTNESVVASTDFDGDGVDDIITRDPVAKSVVAIRMRDGKSTGVEYAFNIPSSTWQVVPHKLVGGLLIRDALTGAVKRVTRDPTNGTIAVTDAPSPGRGELIEGIGDLDGDGNDDMVCRNPDTGDVSIWRLDEKGQLIAMRVVCLNGLLWKIEGVHDWDGDGIEDLLLSHDHTRRLIVMHVLLEDGQSTFGSNLRIGNMGTARLIDVADR
ncbi:MAG: VCBS repeat-containing protein, partial [Planctomycetes bacterium]|nr:VCBS repeat-containing protein [Planctomycetota bacterium]